MMVRGSVPSLIQGISQQSPSLRPSAYVEDAVNVYPTIIEGLTRRPGSDHIANYAHLVSPIASHWIVRDTGERYFVVADEGRIKVCDLDGTVKTVASPDGWSYVASASRIGFLTVNDYTYIFDRDKTVALTGTVATTIRRTQGCVWVRQGNYKTTYKLRVGYPATAPVWYEATYTTSDTDPDTIRIDNIASQLRGSINTTLTGLGVGFGTQHKGHVIEIYRDTGTGDFLLETHDDATDKDIVSFKESVSSITELPTLFMNGAYVRIRGDEANVKDDWWAKFTTPEPGAGAMGVGYWTEAPAPGAKTTFDAATMPHILVRETDGTFTFKKAAWGTRVCGSEVTHPAPSIVGRKIAAMAALKQRVAFFTENYFVTTRAGDPFNLWQQSARVLLDNDPIDIIPSYDRVFTLRGAAEFQRGLILFADDVQFLTTSGDIFGPKTISTKPLSRYSLQPTFGLLGLQQDRIICASWREQAPGVGYSGVVTFKSSSKGSSDVAFDETSAVIPSLINGWVEWITGSATENLIALKAYGNPNIYVYKESVDGERIVQSAWLPWLFKDREALSGTFIGPNFYVVLKDSANKFAVERISLQPLSSGELTWMPHLDRRVVRPANEFFHDPDGSFTSVGLPWAPTESEQVVLVITTGPQKGAFVLATSISLSTNGFSYANFPGVYEGPGFVGVTARSFGELSTLYYRKPTREGGEEVVTTGSLQLLRGRVSFTKCGPFEVHIKSKNRTETYVEKVALPRFEDPDYTGGEVLQTGASEFPIGEINERVRIVFDTMDSPMPMRIGAFEWTGDLNLNARPL